MITTPAFKDRKFAILGLARSGLAAARSLVAGGAAGVVAALEEVPHPGGVGKLAIGELVEDDGKKKTIKIAANQDMPQHSVFGIINYAAEKYQFTVAPDEDEDDDFYDPNWFDGQ
jgi:hypothetical protein